MEKYWPYIAMVVSLTSALLIAIFRNQLALVGDSLAKKGNEIKQVLSYTIGILAAIGAPAIMFGYGSRLPLSTNAVVWMVAGMAILVFNLAFGTSMLVYEKQRKRNMETDTAIQFLQQKLNKLEIKELFEQKQAKDKQLMNERTRLLLSYMDIKLKMMNTTNPIELKKLEADLQDFHRKLGQFGI
jgi:hypothetical protein